MKTTYLLNKKQDDGSIRLTVVDSSEWLSVVNLNQNLPKDQRRYFIVDYIPEGDTLDRMVIEVSADDYRKWNREHTASERNRSFQRSNYQLISLDALTDIPNNRPGSDVFSTSELIDEKICSQIMLETLRKQLSAWKPWANDLLDYYLQGKQRSCTSAIVEKYGVSTRMVRKYKKQFEEFIINFFR